MPNIQSTEKWCLCRAEAERMRMKASAYKQYGDAAILAMVLEALPQIAAEVSAPLAKTDEIVLIGMYHTHRLEVNCQIGGNLSDRRQPVGQETAYWTGGSLLNRRQPIEQEAAY